MVLGMMEIARDRGHASSLMGAITRGSGVVTSGMVGGGGQLGAFSCCKYTTRCSPVLESFALSCM